MSIPAAFVLVLAFQLRRFYFCGGKHFFFKIFFPQSDNKFFLTAFDDGGGASRLQHENTAGRKGHGEACGKVAALARRGRAFVLGLLSCGEAARGRAGAGDMARGEDEEKEGNRKW